MNEQHIIENLDSRPFAEFSEKELLLMREHGARCGRCEIAFQSAREAAAVLKFEAGHALEPSPFFQARVAAALKEKRSGGLRPVLDLWKIWQASGALVSIMVAMVAALFFAGTVAPRASGNISPSAAADTAEAVIFEQDNTLRDITSEQIFQEIYER
jgi:hypothetical protein